MGCLNIEMWGKRGRQGLILKLDLGLLKAIAIFFFFFFFPIDDRGTRLHRGIGAIWIT